MTGRSPQLDPRIVHGLKPEHVEDLRGVCHLAQVPAGAVLMEPGDDDRSMLMLLDGEIELLAPATEPSAIPVVLAGGSSFGAEALRGMFSVRTRTAICRMDSQVMVLEALGLQELVQRANPVEANIDTTALREACARLREQLVALRGLRISQPLPELPKPRRIGLFARLGRAMDLIDPDEPELADIVATLATCQGFDSAQESLLQRLEQQSRTRSLRRGDRAQPNPREAVQPMMVVEGRLDAWFEDRGGMGTLAASVGPFQLAAAESAIDSDGLPLRWIAGEDSVVIEVPRGIFADALISRDPDARTLRAALAASMTGVLRGARSHGQPASTRAPNRATSISPEAHPQPGRAVRIA